MNILVDEVPTKRAGILRKLAPVLGAAGAGALAGVLLLRVAAPDRPPAEPPAVVSRQENAASDLLRDLLDGLMNGGRPSSNAGKEFGRMGPDERHSFYSTVQGGTANPKPPIP